VDKLDYFNILESRRAQALKRKEALEQGKTGQTLLKLHRHEIKEAIEREVRHIHHQRDEKAAFRRFWTSVCVLQRYFRNVQARFKKHQAIFIEHIVKFFKARKIQRWVRYHLSRLRTAREILG
jgi:hypothetical protein